MTEQVQGPPARIAEDPPSLDAVDPWPGVSVVIPTTGRAELARAIASVQEQTYRGQLEIVVVNDSGREIETAGGGTAPVRIISTAGREGGARARNLGVSAARYPWVAFLDDDDEFRHDKLEVQVAAGLQFQRAGTRPVIASRHVQVGQGGDTSAPIPKRAYRARKSVAEYLFVRRRPAGGRASMYTSTLLCPRDLAIAEPWDESLTRHQDWDWVVRLDQRPDVRFVQLDEPLTRVHTGSAGSISSSMDWETSVAWADRCLRPLGRRVYVDFLAGQSLRYALGSRSGRGAWACIRRICQTRVAPTLGPSIIALGGLIPRKAIIRFMNVIR